MLNVLQELPAGCYDYPVFITDLCGHNVAEYCRAVTPIKKLAKAKQLWLRNLYNTVTNCPRGRLYVILN